MSRIGKQPVEVPKGVKVGIKNQHIKVSGKLGNLEMDIVPTIKLNYDENDGVITLTNDYPDSRKHKQLHGTMRALVANMVTGVSDGFEKKMEIYGTGFNVKEQAGKLVFQLGYCHPIEFKLPKDVKVNIEVDATRGNDVPAKFSVIGPNKSVLGELAAEIRASRPPEPYKGKGIRYADEHVQRKEGKAFATGAA
jgi:large subunit ribosomal protein L6